MKQEQTGLILAPDFLARDILAGTFHHRNISPSGRFRKETIRHVNTRDISAPGYFSTESYRHMDISAKWTFRHSNTFRHRCQNVHIALYGAEISQCRNVPVPKCPRAVMSQRRNVLVPKSP
jgi:hypothetical protein